MENKRYTTIERIIAKIDNDFNPGDSDWIPRVAAWCIDAMEQLKVTPTVRKRRKLTVRNRFAKSDCDLECTNLKVFDKNGCEVNVISGGQQSQCGNSFTGREDESADGHLDSSVTPSTLDHHLVPNQDESIGSIAVRINSKDYPARYNVADIVNNYNCVKHYILVDCKTIELDYDANYIVVEYDAIKTYESNNYNTELPFIPNNGLLIEALGYYCIYKMLCRGYKHPVFNLAASQYGTNPYYQWSILKDKAKASIIGDNVDAGNASKLFRSTLFIDTFDPRN